VAQAKDGSGGARERRRSWPVRKYRLGSEPSDDLSTVTTAQERLEMMWPLALEAWSLSGRPLPDYARVEAPVRRFRRTPS
jgi:hypothetical protein